MKKPLFTIVLWFCTCVIYAQSVKSDSLFAIGVDLYNAEKYQEAIPVFEACDKLDKAELDSTSNRREYSSMWLASCYYHLKDSAYAETLSEYYRFLPVDRRLTIKSDSLSEVGNLYYEEGDLNNSLSCMLRCADIEKKVVGERHIWYGNTIRVCGRLYGYLNDSVNALRYMKESINITKWNYGEGSFEYIEAQNELAAYYSYIENHPAEIYIRQIILNSIEKDNPCYFDLLWKLARSYENNGDNQNALQINSEVLLLCEKEYGQYSSQYVGMLNNMSLNCYHVGNHSEGIRMGLRALELYLALVEKSELQYTNILNNLAMNYERIGNLAKAIDLEEECLRIQKQLLKNDDEVKLYYSLTLTNLIAFYALYGRYNDAIELGPEALTACEKRWGKEHSKYAYVLNNLAISHSGLGHYEDAVRLAKEDLIVTEHRLGKEHPDYATVLYNLSNYLYCMGNYSEAISFGTEALKIRKKIQENSSAIFSVLKLLSDISYAKNDIIQLEKNVVEATNCLRTHIFNNFSGLVSEERNTIWNKYSYWFSYYIHAYATLGSDSLIANGYNGILLCKGLLLNTEMELRTLLMESDNLKAISLYDTLNKNKSVLNLELEKPISERICNIDSLVNETNKLERELLHRSKEFGDYTRNLRISWQDVRKKLARNDVAIEFVSVPYSEDTTICIAYVLRNDMRVPQMVPLFEEKQLKKGEGLYKNTSVSKLVWEPLAEYLDGVQNVYFAPSGELYNIGIEYLPHWKGEGIMSEKWNMYRLSSTRQLAVIKDKNALKQASVYGGVKYDTKEDLLVADSRKYRSQERSFNYEPFAIADSLNLRAGALYLPATKTEAEEIDKTLEQKKIMTKLLIDTLATEGAFKDLSGKKTNLLHIATHGFYWTEKEAKYKDNLSFLMLNDNQPRYVEDKALTRSGLLLAGANHALMGKKLPEGVDDGILTAKEISQLDLRGLDLVVLSACETGLGEIKGDGVFGLQRGFKKAGANSLLMSLWKVDDNATQLLMTQFYKNLTSGMSKFESLRQAQKYVREYEVEVEVKSDIRPSVSAHAKEQAQQNANKEKAFKKVKKYEDPKYWAAFILLDAID